MYKKALQVRYIWDFKKRYLMFIGHFTFIINHADLSIELFNYVNYLNSNRERNRYEFMSNQGKT